MTKVKLQREPNVVFLVIRHYSKNTKNLTQDYQKLLY